MRYRLLRQKSTGAWLNIKHGTSAAQFDPGHAAAALQSAAVTFGIAPEDLELVEGEGQVDQVATTLWTGSLLSPSPRPLDPKTAAREAFLTHLRIMETDATLPENLRTFARRFSTMLQA